MSGTESQWYFEVMRDNFELVCLILKDVPVMV